MMNSHFGITWPIFGVHFAHLMTTPKKWAVKHSVASIFLKPSGALAEPPLGCDLVLPQHLDEVHHEVELVLKLGVILCVHKSPSVLI